MLLLLLATLPVSAGTIVPLRPGWNSVALPVERVTSVAAEPEVVGVAFYENGAFRVAAFSLEALAEPRGRACYVYATRASSFTYTGSGDLNATDLVSGYNLVSVGENLTAQVEGQTVPLAGVLAVVAEIQPDGSLLPPGPVLHPELACWVYAVQPVRLLRGSSPQPPSGRLAFAEGDRAGVSQIIVSHPDGTGRVALTSGPEPSWFPAWSPDGRRLAFTRDGSGVWLMNADGSGAHRVGEGYGASWSPDGQLLALTRVDDGVHKIYTLGVDGTPPRRLTDTGPQVQESVARFSPDGRRLAFSSNLGGLWEIWLANLDDGRLTRLTTAYFDAGLQADIEQKVPAWSPDGTWIAYWQGVEGPQIAPGCPGTSGSCAPTVASPASSRRETTRPGPPTGPSCTARSAPACWLEAGNPLPWRRSRRTGAGPASCCGSTRSARSSSPGPAESGQAEERIEQGRRPARPGPHRAGLAAHRLTPRGRITVLWLLGINSAGVKLTRPAP